MTSERKHNQRRRRWQEVRQKLEDLQAPPEQGDRSERLPDEEEDRRALVERRIQEAMENGAFDNLPGRGKPLNLVTNPYLEPGQELAFNLLKNNGFAPEWIERDQAIRRETEAARGRLALAWHYYQVRPEEREGAWQAAVARFAKDLEKLNRQIDDFNLVVPVVTCQRFRLRLEDEVRRVQESR